ncbi:RNA-binding domain-containing protein [Guyanagaster necrorhizus]|uniref:RNA-binding domain-containing protein n=1 Tax=Guyanagaster necrorhizus TaxID=856835 RepID=A0A9P7VJG0_9AGAR|nr:RNA-binding domain-containing protein [Guyanagaster necrorhizus MCA 3950]KAG7441465.1 RNA-binding domain-containing protein [Guyanagaster necrorhizus MCA 3950]
MSTLGKRKERDEEPVGHGSTLFVSNLPYTATSVDLQTLFSDIAPVRSAFVVKEAGTGVSKGVGYVSFAIKEDAQAAFDKISADGLALVGRNLRVQWPENKPKGKTEKAAKVESKPKQIPIPRPRAPQDPLAIRTIIVTGLPSSVDSKALLWKKFRKYKGAESVEWPVDEGAAHVLFSTPAAAHEAVDKLHAHVYKGSLLSVALKKRLDSLAKASKADTKTAAPNHSSRLIIRNTPFNITEQDLRALFLPHGPIHSIHIPKNKDSGRSRGFAFVWMLSKQDAEKAMESCNGKVIRAGMAEGMVLDKQKKKKQRRLEKKMQQGEGANGDDDNDEPQDAEKSSERTIAVDWALSKDKWEEEKTRMEEDDDVEMKDTSSRDDTDEDSDEEEQLGVHDGTDDDADDSSEEEGEHDEEPVKPQLPPPETGTTLFIRNVPFTATEDELRTLFRAFGALRYARITLDGSTGRSRGTGFACFWNKDDADNVVEQSDLLKAETTGAEPAVKKNPFSMPSILTPDPSSSLAQSLVLHGRTLDVVRAVTRDEAGKLKEEGERKREKADKRNMYLLREGVILPNSPAAQVMAQTELERRTASFGARKALLNSNPSLYVSKTRLSIRQIPIFVSERVLKRLALYAAREFESDVKKGERNGLTADELAVEVDRKGQLDDDDERKKKKKPDSRVKQAKVVRQHERVDQVTGKGRSKGYGFVEMHTHADSLRVLRWANNNPNIGKLLQEWYKEELKDLVKAEKGKGKEKDDARLKRLQDEQEKAGPAVKGTLIVEFSIENVQVVQRRSIQQRERASHPDKEKKDKKKKTKIDAEELPSEQGRPAKKVRTEETAKKGLGRSLGSLIGRKRKERKGKH